MANTGQHLFSVYGSFAVKSFRITGFEFVDIHLQNILKRISDRMSGLGQVPGDIAQFLREFFPVKRMPLRQMLFHEINSLTRFTTQAHHTVDEHVLLRELGVQRPQCQLLVFINCHQI